MSWYVDQFLSEITAAFYNVIAKQQNIMKLHKKVNATEALKVL